MTFKENTKKNVCLLIGMKIKKKYGSTFYGIEDVNVGTVIQSKALENVSKDGMVFLQPKDGIN